MKKLSLLMLFALLGQQVQAITVKNNSKNLIKVVYHLDGGNSEKEVNPGQQVTDGYHAYDCTIRIFGDMKHKADLMEYWFKDLSENAIINIDGKVASIINGGTLYRAQKVHSNSSSEEMAGFLREEIVRLKAELRRHEAELNKIEPKKKSHARLVPVVAASQSKSHNKKKSQLHKWPKRQSLGGCKSGNCGKR